MLLQGIVMRYINYWQTDSSVGSQTKKLVPPGPLSGRKSTLFLVTYKDNDTLIFWAEGVYEYLSKRKKGVNNEMNYVFPAEFLESN